MRVLRKRDMTGRSLTSGRACVGSASSSMTIMLPSCCTALLSAACCRARARLRVAASVVWLAAKSPLWELENSAPKMLAAAASRSASRSAVVGGGGGGGARCTSSYVRSTTGAPRRPSRRWRSSRTHSSRESSRREIGCEKFRCEMRYAARVEASNQSPSVQRVRCGSAFNSKGAHGRLRSGSSVIGSTDCSAAHHRPVAGAERPAGALRPRRWLLAAAGCCTVDVCAASAAAAVGRSTMAKTTTDHASRVSFRYGYATTL